MRHEARGGGNPGAADTFQTSHYRGDNLIRMMDAPPMPGLSRMIDAHILKITDADRWRQDAFQTDPRVSQAMLALCKARAKTCPLCMQLGKPDTRHHHFQEVRSISGTRLPGVAVNQTIVLPKFHTA